MVKNFKKLIVCTLVASALLTIAVGAREISCPYCHKAYNTAHSCPGM